jgi:murein L,D-transpeptidase YcbB/YkuD
MKRSEFLRLAAMAPLAFIGGPARAQSKGDFGARYGDVQAAVAAMLDTPDRLPLPLERVRAALKAHYVDNAGTIYWAGTGRMTPFLQRLGRAASDGLNPDDYPIEPLASIRDAANDGDPVMAARAELYYSAFFLAYASDLKIGRTIPSKVDPRLFRTRKTVDLLRILTELTKQRDPGKFLGAFEPRNPHYRALKQGLRDYRARIAEGWPALPVDGAMIKPGTSDPRIPTIREILRATGDYGWSGTGSKYDEQLVIAVRRFQARHGLEAKGNIGKQTLLAMNVGPEERARQIMLNMERWRWMPENLGDYHFMVNIAAFELQRVQSNTIVERMDVVTGAVATQTPEFSDELEYIEFNPTWTVPYSIATKEMLPKLRRNPYAYAADFDVFQGGRIVSWGSIDWAAYGPGSFPFTFRQRPGPKNALGKVKFMLPNKHNIYLHDTPAKEKFQQTTRAFSHGCIRLSKPIDLAYTVATESAGWSETQVTAAFASGKTTRAMLRGKVPVHLIYATAFMGDGGEIEFRPDVYGRDRKLYNALFAQPTA